MNYYFNEAFNKKKVKISFFTLLCLLFCLLIVFHTLWGNFTNVKTFKNKVTHDRSTTTACSFTRRPVEGTLDTQMISISKYL